MLALAASMAREGDLSVPRASRSAERSPMSIKEPPKRATTLDQTVRTARLVAQLTVVEGRAAGLANWNVPVLTVVPPV